MNIPQRWQRQRKAGARQPDNCRYVGRGSPYGNDYKVITMDGTYITCYAVDNLKTGYQTGVIFSKEKAHEHAVEMHKIQMIENLRKDPAYYDKLLNFKYISCFCPLDLPCHCDPIIEHLKERIKVLEMELA